MLACLQLDTNVFSLIAVQYNISSSQAAPANTTMHMQPHGGKILGGCSPRKLLEIRCSEIASGAIFGQKQSYFVQFLAVLHAFVKLADFKFPWEKVLRLADLHRQRWFSIAARLLADPALSNGRELKMYSYSSVYKNLLEVQSNPPPPHLWAWQEICSHTPNTYVKDNHHSREIYACILYVFIAQLQHYYFRMLSSYIPNCAHYVTFCG